MEPSASTEIISLVSVALNVVQTCFLAYLAARYQAPVLVHEAADPRRQREPPPRAGGPD